MVPLYETYGLGVPEICLKKAQSGRTGDPAGNPWNPPVVIRCEQPQSMVEEELLHQMNLQVKKEELLHLDPEKVYDEDVAKVFEENFSFRYPFEKVTELPAKMTVSELKRAGEEEEEAGVRMYEPEADGSTMPMEEAEQEEEFVPIVPAFMQREEKTLQGAARGNCLSQDSGMSGFYKSGIGRTGTEAACVAAGRKQNEPGGGGRGPGA